MKGRAAPPERRDYRALLARIDLRGLAEEAGADFGRAAGRSSRCPLHSGADNERAFQLYKDSNGVWRWHCFTRCPRGHNDGDAIDFYMRWRQVGFREAVAALEKRFGMPASFEERRAPRGTRHKRYESRVAPPVLPARPTPGPPRPASRVWDILAGRLRSRDNRDSSERDAAGSPAPSAPWQARAAEFARYAAGRLWSPGGKAALAYLTEVRGLSGATIRRWGLGYNPYDILDRPERWGLGGSGSIWVPRGIVIPAWAGHGPGVYFIKIRRPVPRRSGLELTGGWGLGDALAQAIGETHVAPGMKYVQVRGGRPILYVAETLSGKPVVLLTGGEFDALLAWQAAGGLAGVAAIGDARYGFDPQVQQSLANARLVFVACSSAQVAAVNDLYLNRMQARVTRAQLPPCPGSGAPAHDITDYWQGGGDVRAWIETVLHRS